MQVPTFEYDDLQQPDQIRLLEVEPCDETSSPLRGRIHHVHLNDDENLSYVALSYAWGEMSSSEVILINDRIHHIQHNLGTALRYFRCTSAIKYIWADAISINQQNSDEKSWQIPLMGQIYREALQVRVWLGDEPQNVSLMKQARTMLRQFSEGEEPPYKNNSLRLALLSHLAELPWFTRRWVVQEVTMNSTVSLACGQIEIPWLRLVALLRNLEHCIQGPGPDAVQPLRMLVDVWSKWNIAPMTRKVGRETEVNQYKILDLLASLQAFKCADGRDRLAALFGLASDMAPNTRGDPVKFSINYAQNTEDNYVRFAEALAAKSMAILLHEADKHREHDNDIQESLPSWVPDWRQSRNHGLGVKEKALIEVLRLQRSQTGRSHRLATKVSVPKNEKLSEIPGTSAKESFPAEMNKKVFKPNITPFELVWRSETFDSDVRIADLAVVADWITTAALELYAWMKMQRLNYWRSWANVLQSIFRTLTLGKFSLPYHELEVLVPSNSRDDIMGYIEETLRNLVKSGLYQNIFHRIHKLSLFVIVVTNSSRASLDCYLLGIGPGRAMSGDKIIVFPEPQVRIPKQLGDHIAQGHLFREMPMPQNERYSIVYEASFFSNIERVTTINTKAYQFVGIGYFYVTGWVDNGQDVYEARDLSYPLNPLHNIAAKHSGGASFSSTEIDLVLI